ncbi:metalloregulator ArsR/SmtB family transcription factor [Hydrogenophaga sp.]|uniref:ArsR/SmtB family transcription factor n=1 Tax=Hydrogenophaga sp. TaxID=1904254 RepID=UPI002626E8BC|nr:metalloregulator ArsR/SmtB family transcription factor [Hydrogenophaga sp.]MCW5654276.1 helix-turn-helix transcriptional regulator [Hydrogenophaga sp.]
MLENDVIRSLSALAHAHRLRIFRTLVVAGDAGLTPGVLASQLEVGATTLSFHLKELTATGLVTQQRDGRHLIYRAAYAHMNGLLAYLTENCCQGAPCAASTEGGDACTC